MHEMVEFIVSRKSCRAFLDTPVPQPLLEEMVAAGLSAPSARNSQSTVLVVNQDKDTIQAISALNASVMGASSDPFYGAPAVIHVLAPADYAHRLVDGACVMENLLLAAHGLGLGARWINRAAEVFNGEEGKALLAKWGLEGDYEGIAHCVIGYPNETPPEKPRREGRVFMVD